MFVREAATFIQSILQTDGHPEVRENSLARQIGITIFEAPVRQSGYISKSLVDDFGYRKRNQKPCNDHYYGRQNAGFAIIRENRKQQLTIEQIEELVKLYSGVHMVTSEENTKLSYYQNNHRDKTWKEWYDYAGIELVENIGLPSKYFYNTHIIDGKTYANLYEASKDTGCDYDTIKKRVASSANIWENWKVVK